MKTRIIATAAALILGVTSIIAAHTPHIFLRLSQPGTLDKEISLHVLYATDSLTVEGPMNLDDLHVICEASEEGMLRHLNLANATFTDNKLPDNAFFLGDNHWVSFNKVILPDDITELGEYSFAKTIIKSIDFPEHLTSVGVGTFSWSTIGTPDGEWHFRLPDGIEELPDKCFYLAGGGHIDLPSTVKTIAPGCFYRTEYASVTFPESLESIGEEAFRGSMIPEVVLPANCSSIGQYAFMECPLITKIVLPTNLSEIPADFAPSCLITEIDIPANVRKIGNRAFRRCNELKSITFHEGLEVIESNAFESDYHFETIELPSTLNLIESKALGYVEKVYCAATTPPQCNQNAISGKTLYVPIGSSELYKADPVWCKFRIEEIEASQFPSAIRTVSADNHSGITISATDGELRIASETTAVYTVYTADGRMVTSGLAAPEASIALPGGIYIVRAGKQTVKISL